MQRTGLSLFPPAFSEYAMDSSSLGGIAPPGEEQKDVSPSSIKSRASAYRPSKPDTFIRHSPPRRSEGK